MVPVTSKSGAVVQILQAAEQFLDDGDYEKVLIQGNRLLSVASLWSEDRTLVPVAVVMRLAANDIAFASSQDGKLDLPQKQECERLLTGLRALVESSPVDPGAPWTEFANFKQSFWSKAKGGLEGKAYTYNPEFVDSVLRWSSTHLQSTGNLLRGARGSPFTGTANEVDWVVRGFGANPRQAASYGLLCALSWQSEFERWKRKENPDSTGGDVGPSEFESLAQSAVPLLDPSVGDWRAIATALDGIIALWRADISTYFDFIVASQNQTTSASEEEPEADEQKPARRGFRKERGSRGS
jgi:hypothetical protein